MKPIVHAYQRCDGITRRDVLRVGGLTALGLGIADLLAMRKASAGDADSRPPRVRANACILIWLDGGPSHLETFDPKPDAPSEVRGPLSPISTSLTGVQISECLPETAKRMDKIALIRSSSLFMFNDWVIMLVGCSIGTGSPSSSSISFSSRHMTSQCRSSRSHRLR